MKPTALVFAAALSAISGLLAQPNATDDNLQRRQEIWNRADDDLLRHMKESVRVSQATPGSPQIVSFDSDKRQISEGDTATLRWITTGAEKVLLEAYPMRGNSSVSDLPSTGFLSVSPSVSTTYELKASSRRGLSSVSQRLHIRVIATPEVAGTCSVSGRVTGRWRVQVDDPTGRQTGIAGTSTYTLKSMRITSQDSGKLVATAPLSLSGRYTFENLPAGKKYKIAPELGWRHEPQSRIVSCTANESHRADFRILGPMID